MRVTLYLRVSQDKRKRHASVSEQDTANRDAVGERELGEVVATFCDNDVSASEYATQDRPDFLDLHRHIAAGETDVICAWEGSRITRVMQVGVEFRDLCRKHNVTLYIVESDRLYDFSRVRDRRDVLDEFADSEQESGKNSQRILRSVKSRAAEGKPHGKLLYGYQREYDPHSRELLRQVPREDQAQYVREAGERVARGESAQAVADDYTRRGVPPPRGRAIGWDPIQIRRMLTNRAYIGKRIYRGQEVGQAQWPAILDETTYYTCEARLTDPARRTNKDITTKHLLSGIARCGAVVDGVECGEPMRVVKNRGYLTYMCWPKTTSGGRSFHTARREPMVDRRVEWALFERLSADDARDWLARVSGDEGAAAARDELIALEQRLEAFYREAEDGSLSPSTLSRMERTLAPQIEAARARAHPAHLPGAVQELIQPSPEEVHAAWEPLDITVKREVLRALLTVRVLPAGRGNKRPDPATYILVDFAGEG